MIEESYVSFAIAKLLKEKGFDVAVRTSIDLIYLDRDDTEMIFHLDADNWNAYSSEHRFSCPTLQLACKWLREVHHLYIQVMLDSWACGGHTGYYVVIQKTDSNFEMMLQDAVNNVFYQTYEQASEAAIKYCLEDLI